MAKKSRRNKSGVRFSPAQMVQPQMNGATDTAVAQVVASSAPQASDLQEEYRYVVADLKRIGIIALVMLAALIVLALVLI